MLKKLLATAAALLFSAGLSYALFTQSLDKLQSTTSSVPVISACGGTTAPAAGSNDMAGEFTVAQAGCVLTFGTAYQTAPSCVVT